MPSGHSLLAEIWERHNFQLSLITEGVFSILEGACHESEIYWFSQYRHLYHKLKSEVPTQYIAAFQGFPAWSQLRMRFTCSLNTVTLIINWTLGCLHGIFLLFKFFLLQASCILKHNNRLANASEFCVSLLQSWTSELSPIPKKDVSDHLTISVLDDQIVRIVVDAMHIHLTIFKRWWDCASGSFWLKFLQLLQVPYYEDETLTTSM